MLDSLRWKGLQDNAAYYKTHVHELTPAGAALLTALNLLHPEKPRRTR